MSWVKDESINLAEGNFVFDKKGSFSISFWFRVKDEYGNCGGYIP